MSNDLPSVVQHLTPEERARVMYMQPGIGAGLTTLYDAGAGRSLFGEVQTIRRLQVLPWTAIPMHVHPLRKKIYVSQGGGVFQVILYEGQEFTQHLLTGAGHSLVIWPNHPHAVMNFSDQPVDILVFMSAGEASTLWEPATSELLKNLHLNK